MEYCTSVFQTKRWKTREVRVGSVGVGGTNPVRIQSMTTSNTRDVAATADQIMRLADIGCEIVRVTVQGIKEAEACEGIKTTLIQKGYLIPIVADIHFYPPAALRVADFVDKVRINPGNFVDKRASFKTIVYDDKSYAHELDRIEEAFSPLVEKCKKFKRALRIGTNHGSLSDRIMNRYGDTAFGMVESALEFARICRKLDFHDLIFSMKASNPLVMIQAYRLLVAEMIKLGWDYPLHLGVTESGEGEDGRVKSSVGIGSLLLDGLGDTIRISLTEDPWEEIDPCKRLVRYAESYLNQGIAPFNESRNIAEISRRTVDLKAPLHRDGSVFLYVKPEAFESADFSQKIGYHKMKQSLDVADALISSIQNVKVPIPVIEEPILVETDQVSEWEKVIATKPTMIFLSPKVSRLHTARKFFEWLKSLGLNIPVILAFEYDCSYEDLVIQASAECGALLSDGLGEGIALKVSHDIEKVRLLSFNILQAARMRTSKTEYISCPGCGRTLFQLQDVTRRIRDKTAHLPGVKIAVMGCIVNGPGEMADADFGYVGSKPGKIDLYVGKKCVQKDIDFADADEKLVELIKSHGRWVEKELILID